MSKTFLPHLTNAEVTEAARDSVLLLPLGTVESNGPHQILGCDFILAERLAMAVEGKAGAIRMPTFHYGISEIHGDLPGTISLSEPLFSSMLEAIICGAARHGFRRIIALNCHRNNHQPLEFLARKLRREGRVDLAVIDPLEVAKDIAGPLYAGDPKAAGGHGGEPLMSLIAYLVPDEIRMDLVATPGLAAFGGLEAISSTRFKFNGSRVGLFPLTQDLNPSGAWADVSGTTAERGAKTFAGLVDYLIAFVAYFRSAHIEPVVA